VPVSVTDKSGRAEEGLSARDFRLLDDGVPREVTLDTFDTGVAPISLVIAIQTSGISGPALANPAHRRDDSAGGDRFARRSRRSDFRR
jgi:hypothetical protein